MKMFLHSLLVPIAIGGMFAGASAQLNPPPIEPWMKAAVIVADKTNNIVYARKIDGGDMFSFSVKKEDTKKFLPEDEISAQVKNQKVYINASKTNAEERISVTNLHSPWIWANEFYQNLLLVDTKNAGSIKTRIQPFRKMLIDKYRESNLVKACCDSGTANGG